MVARKLRNIKQGPVMHNPIKNIFNGNANWKKIAAPLAVVAGLTGLAGCDTDAKVASRNLSQAADMFEINRRIVFYNGITGEFMLNIEGRCSIQVDTQDKQLEVTCKTGEKEFKKHFLGLSDNVTYFAEQVDGVAASTYHYRVEFKPQSIIPDIRVHGDAKELQKSVQPR